VDFVSLLGGIVLGAAGAAIMDSKSGFGLGSPAPAPPPVFEAPRHRTIQVRTAVPTPRLRGGYPVMNRIGGLR